MADDDLANDCSFQWNIHNPFLPGRDLEATFYQGSPTITQWKFTLQPLDRGQQHWRYLVSLAFDETNDDRDEIIAESIRLSIELDGISVLDVEVPNYNFSQRNGCKCCFGTVSFHYHHTVEHKLVIKLDISLPRAARENEGNWLVSNDCCLESLSEDLGKLLLEEGNPDRCPNCYHNVNLLPRNDPQPIGAHTYMLLLRWKNFFRKHAKRDTVQTNISRDVLMDILTYVYTGKCSTKWPIWTNHDYISELFHVIHWYGLYHLHKVFVKSDLQQLRVTRNPVILQSQLFPLNLVNGRQIRDVTHIWKVGNNPELTFRFIFKNENQAGPWLSYTLQSTSSDEVRVNVNLAVIKKRRRYDDPLEEISTFHERDHTVKPDETVESRYVLFLGCPETFGTNEGSEIDFYIQCYLGVTDGTTTDQIQNADDPALQDVELRLGVLSDHMRQLQAEGLSSDTFIFEHSRAKLPKRYRIHKGIIVSRWPDWVEVLENEIDDVPPEIPEIPVCILDRDYLSFVLDYTYTGRVFTVMYSHAVVSFEAIYNFATRCRFRALADLMHSRSMRRFSLDLEIGPEIEPYDISYPERDDRVDLLGDVARGVVEEEDLIGVELQRIGIK